MPHAWKAAARAVALAVAFAFGFVACATPVAEAHPSPDVIKARQLHLNSLHP